MNCRTPGQNYFYLLSPETCRILELDGEGSGYGSGSHWAGPGCPQSAGCPGRSFNCTALWGLGRYWNSRACGVGKDWKDRTLFPLFSAGVLVRLFPLSLSVPSGVTGLCVFHCHTDFLAEGNHTSKTFSVSYSKQSFLPLCVLDGCDSCSFNSLPRESLWCQR